MWGDATIQPQMRVEVSDESAATSDLKPWEWRKLGFTQYHLAHRGDYDSKELGGWRKVRQACQADFNHLAPAQIDEWIARAKVAKDGTVDDVDDGDDGECFSASPAKGECFSASPAKHQRLNKRQYAMIGKAALDVTNAKTSPSKVQKFTDEKGAVTKNLALRIAQQVPDPKCKKVLKSCANLSRREAASSSRDEAHVIEPRQFVSDR